MSTVKAQNVQLKTKNEIIELDSAVVMRLDFYRSLKDYLELKEEIIENRNGKIEALQNIIENKETQSQLSKQQKDLLQSSIARQKKDIEQLLNKVRQTIENNQNKTIFEKIAESKLTWASAGFLFALIIL